MSDDAIGTYERFRVAPILWCHGLAECLDCNHCWVAVWPLGADALECPKCSSSNTDRDAWLRNSFAEEVAP